MIKPRGQSVQFPKKRFLSGLFIFTLMILVFQNCGKQDSTTDTLSTGNKSASNTDSNTSTSQTSTCSSPEGTPCANPSLGISDGVIRCSNGVAVCVARTGATTTTTLPGTVTTTTLPTSVTTTTIGGGGSQTIVCQIGYYAYRNSSGALTCIRESYSISTINSKNSTESNCNSDACKSNSNNFPNSQNSRITIEKGQVSTFKFELQGPDLYLSSVIANKVSGTCTAPTPLTMTSVNNIPSSMFNEIPLNYFEFSLLRNSTSGTYANYDTAAGCAWNISYTFRDSRDNSGSIQVTAGQQVVVRKCSPGSRIVTPKVCSYRYEPGLDTIQTCNGDGMGYTTTQNGTCIYTGGNCLIGTMCR